MGHQTILLRLSAVRRKALVLHGHVIRHGNFFRKTTWPALQPSRPRGPAGVYRRGPHTPAPWACPQGVCSRSLRRCTRQGPTDKRSCCGWRPTAASIRHFCASSQKTCAPPQAFSQMRVQLPAHLPWRDEGDVVDSHGAYLHGSRVAPQMKPPPPPRHMRPTIDDHPCPPPKRGPLSEIVACRGEETGGVMRPHPCKNQSATYPWI